ncbi:hypothetical protein ACP2AV_00075 [Aliiroseovarius sp. PTFE2010]|uniref:hypothetical protein n=1 Tax=Aliiroseovarius sp. PTFE2010 TaxID=3417190 RepID=UPI003CF35823
MIRTLQAIALTTSLALGGLAPGQLRAADSQDIARAALGAFAILAIGSAISGSTRASSSYSQPKSTQAPPIVREPQYNSPAVQRRLATQMAIPRNCVITRAGRQLSYIPANCLSRAMPHKGKLPQTCRVRLKTQSGLQPAYATACLKRNGYRVAH